MMSIEVVERELNMEELTGADEMYFAAGRYEKVRSLGP